MVNETVKLAMDYYKERFSSYAYDINKVLSVRDISTGKTLFHSRDSHRGRLIDTVARDLESFFPGRDIIATIGARGSESNDRIYTIYEIDEIADFAKHLTKEYNDDITKRRYQPDTSSFARAHPEWPTGKSIPYKAPSPHTGNLDLSVVPIIRYEFQDGREEDVKMEDTYEKTWDKLPRIQSIHSPGSYEFR